MFDLLSLSVKYMYNEKKHDSPDVGFKRETKNRFMGFMFFSVIVSLALAPISGLVVSAIEGDVVAQTEFGLLITFGLIDPKARNFLISTSKSTGELTSILAKLIFKKD